MYVIIDTSRMMSRYEVVYCTSRRWERIGAEGAEPALYGACGELPRDRSTPSPCDRFITLEEYELMAMERALVG